MVYCTQCGAPVQGRFCQQCGAAVTPSEPAAVPAPPPAAATASAISKRSPLLWVLGGCLGLVVIGALIALGAGFFVAHKVQQAGLDPDLMQRNPVLAVTKLITAFNPNVEVLSVDEDRGIITVREKSSGKTLTMDFDDVKNGKIVFMDENGERVSIESNRRGDGGSFTVKTKDGTLTGGAQWTPPDWIPVYSGAHAESGANTQSAEERSGAGYFTTKDSVHAVLKFYEEALRGKGFDVSADNTADGTSTVGTLSAEGADGKRSVNVVATAGDGGTRIHLTYSIKN